MDALVKNVRIIAAFQKDKDISYISHLDVQRTLQRAFRRADLPLAYTNGYNPHPKLSFATALATGFSSTAEFVDIEFEKEIEPDVFLEKVNEMLPCGIHFVKAFVADSSLDTLSKLLCSAKYSISFNWEEEVSKSQVEEALQTILNSTEVVVLKKTKSGVKPTNIRPDILEAHVVDFTDESFGIELTGKLTAAGGLRVETFLNALYETIGVSGFASVHRSGMYFIGSDLLPRLS
jgi:radical SAM-linked protein